MPDLIDLESLTDKYREEFDAREKLARLALLKNYRGAWRELEPGIEAALEKLNFDADESAELQTALVNPGAEGETPVVSADKIAQVADLLLKKRDWQTLEEKVDENFAGVGSAAARLAGADGIELSQIAAGHAVELLDAQLGKKKPADPKALERLHGSVTANVRALWAEKRESLESAFGKAAADAAERARAALRREVLTAVLTKMRAADILRSVKSAIESREGSPEEDPALVRSLRSQYRNTVVANSRETLRETFLRSGEVESWRWVSARTPKTCAICWAMDGRIFSVEVPMNSHPNCRCTMVPVVADGVSSVDSKNSDDPANSANSPDSGNQGFAELPPDAQRAILGAQAFEAYQRGEFDLADLVGVQYTERFGVTLYRKSLNRAIESRQQEIDPAKFIAANFEREQPLPFQLKTPQLRQASDSDVPRPLFGETSLSSSGLTVTNTRLAVSGGFGGGDNGPSTPQKPETPNQLGSLTLGQVIFVERLEGDTQAKFLQRVMARFADAAGLDEKRIAKFVKVRVSSPAATVMKDATAGGGQDGQAQVEWKDDDFKNASGINMKVIDADMEWLQFFVIEQTGELIDKMLAGVTDPALREQMKASLLGLTTGSGDARANAAQELMNLGVTDSEDAGKLKKVIKELAAQKSNSGNPVVQLLKSKIELEEVIDSVPRIGPFDEQAIGEKVQALQRQVNEAASLAAGVDLTTGLPIQGRKVNRQEASWVNLQAAIFLRGTGNKDEADYRDQLSRFYDMTDQERARFSWMITQNPLTQTNYPTLERFPITNKAYWRGRTREEDDLSEFEASREEKRVERDLGKAPFNTERIKVQIKEHGVWVDKWVERAEAENSFTPVGKITLKMDVLKDIRSGEIIELGSARYAEAMRARNSDRRYLRSSITRTIPTTELAEAMAQMNSGKELNPEQQMLVKRYTTPLNRSGMVNTQTVAGAVGLIDEFNRWTPFLADLYYGTTAKRVALYDKLRKKAFWATNYLVPPYPKNLPFYRQRLEQMFGNSPQAKKNIDDIMRKVTELSYAAWGNGQ